MWKPYAIIEDGYSMVWKSDEGKYITGFMKKDRFKFVYSSLDDNTYRYEKFGDLTPIEKADITKNDEMIREARRTLDEEKAFMDMFGKDLG